MDRIEQLLHFLEQSKEDAFLIHALALEYAKLEKYSEAQHYFEKNATINPSYIATYFHLGKTCEKLKTYEKAIQAYDKGLEITKTAGDQKTYNEIFLAKDFLEDEMD